MCQKSALQCQLTCLFALYTVNPSPSPLKAIHIVMRAQKILYKIYQVLGKLSTLINYCIQLQKRLSGAVDQSRDGMGEVMSSSYYMLEFFSVNTFCQKDAC
jgi:hypothetical protein